ncbi:MAG: type VI secretion system tip protein VgrG [Myxococcales bacterium]|nr:type VI secretion system tip protein VgrG [Myxococcales bacterium]
MRPIAFTIGDAEIALQRVTGHLALSELFQLTVEGTVDEEVAAATDLLGEPFSLTLEDPFEARVNLHGVVMSVERRTLGPNARELKMVLAPAVAPLTIGRNAKVFQEMTVVDAVDSVLSAAGISDYRWSIGESYPKRDYIAQYRESDWDFIERLLAEEGIYYTFELEDDVTTLVFADDSTSSPDLPGGAELPHRDASGTIAEAPSVGQIGLRSEVRHTGARLVDYDFAKPAVKLDETAGDTTRELYDYPGRFRESSEGARLTKVRLEGLRATGRTLVGHATTSRMRVGFIFEMTECPIDALNGRYLVTRIDLSEAEETTKATPGAVRTVAAGFTAIPADIPFRAPRPLRVTGDPRGPQPGVVVGPSGEEIHSDDQGRVRVQFHWDREGARDEKASTFMRVGQFALGGSMIMPRIGWSVLTHHHEDDVDLPHVSGHLYDGEHPPPYALPDNKTRTAWQTATSPGDGTSNEVRFEDAAGSEEVFINATKDMNVVVGDNKSEQVGVDHTHDIGANQSVSVGSNLTTQIVSTQSVSIGGSESITVTGDRGVTVTGSETDSIGGSRSVTTIMGQEIDATGGRSLTVGGSMLDISALGVNRLTLGTKSVTVGGSWISAAATGVAYATLGAGAETVGGAKICAGGSGVATTVKGAAAETVGGAYAIAAGGNASETSTGAMAVTVGGAFLGNAPKVQIEADSKIEIRVGGSSLIIKSSSIEIKSPTIAAPGASVKKKGSGIKHN